MIKKIVTLTLFPAVLLMTLLLILGLFVPDSVLRSLGKTQEPSQVTSANNASNSENLAPISQQDQSSEQASQGVQQTDSLTTNPSTQPNTTTNPVASVSSPNTTPSSAPTPTPTPTPAPTPTPTPTPAPTCGAGGSCSLSDIQAHATAADCWSAINANGSGMKAYKIPSSFLTSHASKKGITSSLCGKAYSSNLRSKVGDHNNGKTISGQTYDQAIGTASWYLGPYN